MTGKQGKLIHIEIMRIVAIFWIIFNHTEEEGFFLFSKQPVGGTQFWVYLFMSIFCKFSVPLFLAVSGALLLNRPDESLRDLWLKRILKIAVILVAFTFVYYVFTIVRKGIPFVFRDYLKSLYSTRASVHLWYLYLYIAFLIVLPFLRALVSNLDNKYFIYLLCIAIIFRGVIPSIEYLCSNGEIAMYKDLRVEWILNNAVLYPCLGYFMQHRLSLESIKKHLSWVVAVDIVGICISCYMTYYKGIITGVFTEKDSQAFHGSFVYLNCIAIFMLIRLLYENAKINDLLKRIIISLGSCTFGIYLWHMIIKKQDFFDIYLKRLRDLGLNNMIATMIMCFVVMFITYMITLIQSKIPILKKLVGF